MTIRLLRARLAVQHAEEFRTSAALDALAELAPPDRARDRLRSLADDARDRAGRLLARITALDFGYGVLPVPTIVEPAWSLSAGLRAESMRAIRSADRYEAAKRIAVKYPNVNQYWTCEAGRTECLDLAYALSEMADRADRERGAA